jgi:hypothetical protein
MYTFRTLLKPPAFHFKNLESISLCLGVSWQSTSASCRQYSRSERYWFPTPPSRSRPQIRCHETWSPLITVPSSTEPIVLEGLNERVCIRVNARGIIAHQPTLLCCHRSQHACMKICSTAYYFNSSSSSSKEGLQDRRHPFFSSRLSNIIIMLTTTTRSDAWAKNVVRAHAVCGPRPMHSAPARPSSTNMKENVLDTATTNKCCFPCGQFLHVLQVWQLGS